MSIHQRGERRTDFHFEIMKEEHLEEVCRLLYISFMQTNPLWNKFQFTYEDLADFFRWKVRPSIQTQTSSILICDNKLVGCQIGVDYADYKEQCKEDLPLSEQFAPIMQLNDAIIGDIFKKDIPRGKVLMNHYTAVLPEYQNHGFYLALNQNGFRVAKLGYVNCFTITSNPITYEKSQIYKGTQKIFSYKHDDPGHFLHGAEIGIFEIPLVENVPPEYSLVEQSPKAIPRL